MEPPSPLALATPRGGRPPAARRSRFRGGTLGHAVACSGFTLVEVLVALFIMAILAALAWRGLDGIVRAREGSQAVMDRTLRLNTVVTQWEQDLQAVQETGAVPALSFDGQSLRLTRRVEGGVALVVWAVRGGVWQRWAAPTATRVADISDHWLRSQQLLGNEPGQLTVAEASTWQVYFYRGNAWTNPQSTGNFATPGNAPAAPPAGTPVLPVSPGASGSAGSGPGGANLGNPTNPGAAPDAANAASEAAGGGTAEAAQAAAAAAAAAAQQRELLPDAVRLVITLGVGTLTRDIALGSGGG